ncbi:MAG: ABC transporter permease [Herbinix sp.]|nr:ABC transporter permease [Herbinix sp.]
MKVRSVVISSLVVQIKQTYARNMYKFCLLVSPLMSTILLAEMYRNSEHDNFTSYIVLGAGLMSLWGCICFSSAGDINRERYSNTLSLIFISPSSFQAILFGKVIGNTILSLFSVLLTAVYSFVLYRQPIVIENMPMFLVSFLITIISFMVFSIFVAYILVLSRRTEILMNCIDVPLILVCGFVFPIEVLPMWTQYISKAFPMTWSIKLMRQSIMSPSVDGDFFISMTYAIGTIIVYALLSNLLYKLIAKRVRIEASLEMA